MNKRQKRGFVFLLVGLLLLLAGVFIHWMQRQEDVAAGKTAAVLLQHLEDVTSTVTPNAEDMALPEKTYMGYSLIGEIALPWADIRLPVLNDWNEKMLKAAPCRYQGSISNGNMIIMAHNYKHHFAPLHTVTVGTEVTFTNTVGTTFHYRVAKIERLHRTEGEKLPSDVYPLTLFTCTTSGLERVVVRCERVDS